jgi:hypothetical protein
MTSLNGCTPNDTFRNHVLPATSAFQRMRHFVAGGNGDPTRCAHAENTRVPFLGFGTGIDVVTAREDAGYEKREKKEVIHEGEVIQVKGNHRAGGDRSNEHSERAASSLIVRGYIHPCIFSYNLLLLGMKTLVWEGLNAGLVCTDGKGRATHPIRLSARNLGNDLNPAYLTLPLTVFHPAKSRSISFLWASAVGMSLRGILQRRRPPSAQT